jgi:hypothetical protein
VTVPHKKGSMMLQREQQTSGIILLDCNAWSTHVSLSSSKIHDPLCCVVSHSTLLTVLALHFLCRWPLPGHCSHTHTHILQEDGCLHIEVSPVPHMLWNHCCSHIVILILLARILEWCSTHTIIINSFLHATTHIVAPHPPNSCSMQQHSHYTSWHTLISSMAYRVSSSSQ